MKILVTGGAGFIGSHVVKLLLAQGYDVRVLHLPSENLANLQGLRVELMPGDITSPSCVQKAIKGCRRVFHLAAIYALWLPRMELMREVNVNGTRNVLQACLDEHIEKVVYTSSIAVFGGQGLHEDATEQSPFVLGQTGDLYCQTKFESHQLVMEFASKGLNISVAAPCGPVGPGDIGPTPTGKLLLAALNLPILCGINTSNNVVDVRDVAKGHLLVMDKGKLGESYLLGNQNLSFNDIAKIVFSITGHKKTVLNVPFNIALLGGFLLKAHSKYLSKKAPLITPETIRVAKLGLNANCEKATLELGFNCRPVETSIRDAILWFATNGYIHEKTKRDILLNLHQ